MSWGLFGQIVLLIVIFSFAFRAVKCLHDKCCKDCKPKDECCK
jgi:hypothetical protein